MPFFGVDDILFLLASTTALMWAKRADIVEGSVYTAVHLATNDPKKAAECAAQAADAHGGTPALLLQGFDLQTEEHQLLSLRDCGTASAEPFFRGSRCGSHGSDPGADAFTYSKGTEEEEPLFVKESVQAQFRETQLVYQVPQVPHRHYNPRKRQRHVSWLATASEEDVRDGIGRYTVPEVQTLFDKMEREALWESVIHVSYGIEKAKEELRYLNLYNIECAIRTLLSTAHPYAALVYYFRFGEDVLLSEDILVALFHACRHDEQLSLELCRVLEPFQSRWAPTVYACCLTATARYDYRRAMALYQVYMAAQRRRQQAEKGTLRRVLAASALLREAGAVTPQEQAPLRYLHHIIIPLVAEHDPSSAERYVEDMFENDPDSAPDVFLKCLGFDAGRRLVRNYVKELVKTSLNTSAADGVTLDSDAAVGDVALYLYRLKPSAMNMNTLLKLLTQYSIKAEKVETQVGEQLQQNPLFTDARFCVNTQKFSCPSMLQLCSGKSPELARLLLRVPLQTELDASVLARTITENHASWLLATQFLSIMLRRRCFTVVPGIAAHVARQGQWATAARSMAVYLSNQHAAMTLSEAALCVEANVYAGQWSSALFWVERAHVARLTLLPSTYDLVLSASRHCRFEAAERVVTTMHEVGASCSERGVLDFIEAAAHHGEIAKAFRVLQHHSNLHWTP